AAAAILSELRGSGREWAQVGDTHPVHEAITYLSNHDAQMDYAKARRQRRPGGELQEPVRDPPEACRLALEGGHRGAHRTTARPGAERPLERGHVPDPGAPTPRRPGPCLTRNQSQTPALA